LTRRKTPTSASSVAATRGAGKGHPPSNGDIGNLGKLRLRAAKRWPSSAQAVMMPDVIVARKEEVHIEVKGKVALGKTRKATIRIREHTLKVLIPPDSLAAIEAWKSRPSQQTADQST